MSKDTCPSCVHGKGFKCPVCWPKQSSDVIQKEPEPLQFKGHSWLRVFGDAHTPERFWIYRLLTEEEYALEPVALQTKFRRITLNDIPRLEAKFGEDLNVAAYTSQYKTTEQSDTWADEIMQGKNPLICFADTYRVRQSLQNKGAIESGSLNVPTSTLRFQVHHGSEICQHTHYAGDVSCNIERIASVLPANYFEQLQKEKV